ncbi:NS4 protein [Chobar Gorge virus]|uniref:NS4 protein n=1 Tax=Chobar Gorge virus TaxID=1679172 RepID=A0A0H4M3V8_9REOV|nr:NS4 protein [Chobar Gorge virus]AKP24106.1 NS4 protein [Chobar Gorge virus]
MSSERVKLNSPSGSSMSGLLLGKKWWKEIRKLLRISARKEEMLTGEYDRKTYAETLSALRTQYGTQILKRETRMQMMLNSMPVAQLARLPTPTRRLQRTVGTVIVELQRTINQTGLERWRVAVRYALTRIPRAWRRSERIRAARLFAYLRAETEEQRQVLATLTRLQVEERLLSTSQISEFVTDWQEKLRQIFGFFPHPQKLIRQLYSSFWVRRSLSRSESRRIRSLNRKMRRLGLEG